MRRAVVIAFVVLLALASTRCGYLVAGSWEDDPKNWRRIFGEDTPAEVTVVHSLYTRYPHWTHEHELYVQFVAPRSYIDGFIERFGLRQAVPGTPWSSTYIRSDTAPSWFAPKPVDRYEVRFGSGFRDGFLLIDKHTGDVFFTHQQL